MVKPSFLARSRLILSCAWSPRSSGVDFRAYDAARFATVRLWLVDIAWGDDRVRNRTCPTVVVAPVRCQFPCQPISDPIPEKYARNPSSDVAEALRSVDDFDPNPDCD